MEECTQGYSLKKLFKLTLQFRKELITANIVAIFAVVASAPLPLLIPLLIDQVLLDQPGRLVATMDYFLPDHLQIAVMYIGIVLLVTVLLRLIAWLLTVWQVWIFSRISKEIIFKIRSQLLSRLGQISIAEYEGKGGGTISSYLVNDLETLDQFFCLTISRFVVSAFLLISVAIVLVFLHWQLALLLLLLNPMVIFITMKMGRQMKELKRQENKATEVFQQAVVDVLSVIRQIRVSSRDTHYIRQLVGHARDIRNRSIAYTWRNEMGTRAAFLFFVISFDIFRALSMSVVLFSDLSIGVMIAIFGYLWFMLAPIQDLLDMQYAWFGAKAAIERINNIFRLEREPHYPAKSNPFAGHKTIGISIKKLCLDYGSAHVLKNISLDIQAGDKVAIVGATGSGKTTLIQTMLGLYPFDSGEILYGGVSIQEVGLEAVRENVGCILQNPIMLNDTIRSNLVLGKDIPDDTIWEALETAQIADLVRRKEQQLDTMVGLQGVKLSGGQCQRLAIARALLGKPKIMVLDEATSALDSHTEKALHQALFEKLRECTVLIVAHRLSAVSQANQVYVLEDGQVVEFGKHDDLIQLGQCYQNLFAAQL